MKMMMAVVKIPGAASGVGQGRGRAHGGGQLWALARSLFLRRRSGPEGGKGRIRGMILSLLYP